MHAPRPVELLGLQPDGGPGGPQTYLVSAHPGVAQPGLDLDATSEDLLGDDRVGLQGLVVFDGATAQDDMVGIGPVRGPRRPERRFDEELLEARVVDDDVLAAHGPDRGVRDQLTSTEARAVDHQRHLSGDLAQRA